MGDHTIAAPCTKANHRHTVTGVVEQADRLGASQFEPVAEQLNRPLHVLLVDVQMFQHLEVELAQGLGRSGGRH